jgi:hypothetical protein
MKKAIVGTLLVSGLMFGAKHQRMSSDQVKLDGFQKEALETQSPRVRAPGVKHKKHATDRVTADKHTINAFIPVGK